MSATLHSMTGGGGNTPVRLSRVASALALGVAICCLLGADIQFDPGSPVANPNNMPNTIQSSGTYKLEKDEIFINIQILAYNTQTDVYSIVFAEIDQQKQTWTRMFQVLSGKYKCQARLNYGKIVNNKIEKFYVETDINNITVK